MSRRFCPFLHTGRPRVCEVGHADADSGDYESDCAHVGLRRVQSRTRDRQNGTVPVRLCTRRLLACAKSDTGPAEWHSSCPFLHTGRPRVCKNGHETGRIAPPLSACAHRRVPRVHKRTRRRARGLRASACARGQRPTGPRGRPKRSLRANKGRPSSRFSAGLARRGAPQITGLHARTAGPNPRCARRRSTGRATRQARDEGVREGVRNAQLFVECPTSGRYAKSYSFCDTNDACKIQSIAASLSLRVVHLLRGVRPTHGIWRDQWVGLRQGLMIARQGLAIAARTLPSLFAM